MVVRDQALSPSLEPGDVVLARRRRAEMAERGGIVALRTEADSGSLISRLAESVRARRDDEDNAVRRRALRFRMVAARPGDTVAWSDRTVTVRGGDDLRRWNLAPLHPLLTSPVRQARMASGELFLVTMAPGYADSRVLGPVSTSAVVYRVTRILWPANRRRDLTQ
jgi:type IV secretory pathway protease TraF